MREMKEYGRGSGGSGRILCECVSEGSRARSYIGVAEVLRRGGTGGQGVPQRKPRKIAPRQSQERVKVKFSSDLDIFSKYVSS